MFSFKHHNLTVYVEKDEFEHETMKFNKCLTESLNKSVHLFNEVQECLENKIDLVICLGGDGTLLHVSSLFQVRFPLVYLYHVHISIIQSQIVFFVRLFLAKLSTNSIDKLGLTGFSMPVWLWKLSEICRLSYRRSPAKIQTHWTFPIISKSF